AVDLGAPAAAGGVVGDVLAAGGGAELLQQPLGQHGAGVLGRRVGGTARGGDVAAAAVVVVGRRGVEGLLGLLGPGGLGDRGSVAAAAAEQHHDHRDDQQDDDHAAGDHDPQARVALAGRGRLLAGVALVRVGRLVGLVVLRAARSGVRTRAIPGRLLSAGASVPVGALVGPALVAGLPPGVGIG